MMLDQPSRSNKISRPEVVQTFLGLFESPRYLEIGVATGATFHAVSAAKKVAVDPQFKFDLNQARRDHPENLYHNVTSDEYFGSIVDLDEQFDVIFLDGLHVSHQTLRDLLNATECLAPNGIILLDDVIPRNYAASLPNRREANLCREAMRIKGGAWMGDIYRLVFFIETFMQQFSYHTISGTHGQTVLWRQRRSCANNRTIAEVGGLEYKAVFTEEASFKMATLDAVISHLKSRP